MLQGGDGKAICLLPVIVSNAPAGESTSKLVFNRYGNQYLL
jgi:hypothetical protein